MAIRAWMDGDLRLALRLLQWAQPQDASQPNPDGGTELSYQPA